jgi:hypothetical protein
MEPVEDKPWLKPEFASRSRARCGMPFTLPGARCFFCTSQLGPRAFARQLA